jgi:hypothetical protein
MSYEQELITQTQNSNPKVRLQALKEMCPCKVKIDIDALWKQIFLLCDDPDPLVRYQVLHTICDGCPKHLETEVAEALEKFNHDSDSKIRRRAHKVLGSYLRTGKWNIL